MSIYQIQMVIVQNHTDHTSLFGFGFRIIQRLQKQIDALKKHRPRQALFVHQNRDHHLLAICSPQYYTVGPSTVMFVAL